MKLQLNEKQQRQIEMTAIQQVVQKKITELIEVRMKEMEAELEQLDTSMTAEDMVQKYLGQEILVPTKALLVPH